MDDESSVDEVYDRRLQTAGFDCGRVLEFEKESSMGGVTFSG
jgi:hypothetical protein